MVYARSGRSYQEEVNGIAVLTFMREGSLTFHPGLGRCRNEMLGSMTTVVLMILLLAVVGGPYRNAGHMGDLKFFMNCATRVER